MEGITSGELAVRLASARSFADIKRVHEMFINACGVSEQERAARRLGFAMGFALAARLATSETRYQLLYGMYADAIDTLPQLDKEGGECSPSA